MAINVVPKAAPSSANSQAPQGQNSARDRAIARLSAPTAQVEQAPAEVLHAQAAANVTESPVSEGQTDKVEASSDEVSSEAPKEETKAEEKPLSQQYAILARKEKALRAKVQAQEQAYSAKEAALKAREDALKAKEAEYLTGYIPKSKLTESPWEVLNEAGLTYDQLTELALTAPQQDPATKAQLARLEAQIRAQDEAAKQSKISQEEQQRKAYAQAVSQIRNEANSLVASNPDFETIKETGSVDDVVDLIEQTFKSDGILLSVEEAAKEVEEHLVEEAMKIARIKKIQQRLSPPKAEAPKQLEQPKQQQMKTLTNQVGGSRQLSAKERAILAFKGELK